MSLNLYKYHTNPETLTGFDLATDKVPYLAWDHFRANHEELRKREHVWAKSAKYSYWYAEDVLRDERVEKIEDAIATDAYYSYFYAKDVLKGERVEKIEDAIATSAGFSYQYAIYVLKGKRFEKGEDAISTSAYYSYLYAKDVIKKRLPQGEPIIRGSRWQEDYEQEFGIKL